MTADRQYLQIDRKKIAHELIDGEVVLINVDTGCYYSLRGTAATIWSGIEDGRSLADLQQWTARLYDGDGATVAEAVAGLVAALVDDEIVSYGDAPPPAGDRQGIVSVAAGAAFTAPEFERYDEMRDLLTLDPIHEVDDLGWPHRAAALE